jgi:hypothetical protein
MISETSWVVLGFRTVVERPWNLPIQSLLKGSSSSAGLDVGESVEIMEEGDKIFEKWAMSCSLTGVK